MPEGPITSVPGGQSGVSRRNFIKGVIAAGATVSASAYLFRANIAGQDSALPGSVERLITLNVNGAERRGFTEHARPRVGVEAVADRRPLARVRTVRAAQRAAVGQLGDQVPEPRRHRQLRSTTPSRSISSRKSWTSS